MNPTPERKLYTLSVTKETVFKSKISRVKKTGKAEEFHFTEIVVNEM